MAIPKLLLSVILLATPTLLRAAEDASVSLLRRQLEQILLQNEQNLDRAVGYAQRLREDGSWPEVDYKTPAPSGWPAMRHLVQTEAMVRALRRAHETPENEALLRRAAHAAFRYWIQHDFRLRGPGASKGFGGDDWNNAIGAPQAVGTIALLLGPEITAEELNYAAQKSLRRFPISGEQTGANTASMARIATLRGILTGDTALLAAASRLMWNEIKLTTGEGIQPDFSFHQHGPLLQFGQYGISYATDVTELLAAYRGTPWAAPAERVTILRNYLLEGLQWVAYRGAFDLNSNGRWFTDNRAKVGRCLSVMNLMREADPEGRERYEDFARRNRPPFPGELNGSRFFWRSAYLVHRQGDFYSSVKFSSNRTLGAESFGGNNRSGYHLGDGVTVFHHDGREYEEIFPVWDWRKLPGTTCAQEKLREFRTTSVATDGAGGVSDGNESVAALLYERDGVKARKAWFASGRTLVALGAEITGRSRENIITTVDQCLLRQKPRVVTGELKQPVEPGIYAVEGADAVEHNGLRYEFSGKTPLVIKTGPVVGNWRHVSDPGSGQKQDVTRDTLVLAIDHGKEARGGAYAYQVTRDEAGGATVLRNDGQAQAARFRSGNTGIVFWSAGALTLPEGPTIAVNRACVLLVKPGEVVVADPYHKTGVVKLTVAGRQFAVTLPGDPMAGSSVAMKTPP